MKYDFDRVIDRHNTNSTKWDRNLTTFGREDVLDMWVADMDFPSPVEVVEALRERVGHPMYGYTFAHDGLYEAIIAWNKRRHGWDIKREWIVFTAGVVNGLYSTVRAFTHPGDEIVVQPPVYYPFSAAVKNSGCQVIHNPLRVVGGKYEMDIEHLRGLFRGRSTFPVRVPRIKMLILCSPHNPVGRVWTADEVRAVAEICVANDVILVADEIHCDLLMHGARHTAASTLSAAIEQNTITLNSGSKTFNLAGLATSYAVIPNPKLRRKFMEMRAGENSGNFLGYIAMEAALRHGEDYLTQLTAYVEGNIDSLAAELAGRVPGIKVTKPEGTYLAWLDMRSLGLDDQQLQDFVRNRARLALDDGFAFGPGGEGFQRINLACPRSLVTEAVARLEAAVKGL